MLSHWDRVTHICVSNLTTIGWDNGLSPGRRQAIISTNDGILLIGPLGTNFSEILIKIHAFSFKKIYWKLSSAKWRRFCLGLNVLYSIFLVTQNTSITSTLPYCHMGPHKDTSSYMTLSRHRYVYCYGYVCDRSPIYLDANIYNPRVYSMPPMDPNSIYITITRPLVVHESPVKFIIKYNSFADL